MNRILIEACCASPDDVAEAVRGGADRVELNSALFLGGLTPSIGTVEVARDCTDVPIMAMLRPRSGGFCYTELEFQSMLKDGRELLAHGADGIVFGCLLPDGTVDEEHTRCLVELAGEKDSVFHRAMDVTPDWKRALDTLIRLGVKRVLTSGQAPSAVYALDTIAEMIRFAGNAIEILPGGGVRLENAERIVRATGATQLHLGKRRAVADTSIQCNPGIHFGGALYPPESFYEITDSDYFASMRDLFDR